MRKLFRYLKNYKLESITGPLFKFLEACMELLVPIVMARMIDEGINNADTALIYRLGGVLVLFGVLGFAFAITAQYFAAKAAVGFGCELRDDMFRHINRFSYSELDRLGIPTLIMRMTGDINQVQTGVNLILRLLLRSPFIVVGAIVMSFTINVQLALIFLICAPVLALIIYLVMSKSVPRYKRVQSRLDNVSLHVRENLVGTRVIRAFSKQNEEIQTFNKSSDDLMKEQIGVGKISALLNPFTYVIVNLAICAVIYFGGVKVNSGSITQGEVIALINYLSQILIALIAISNLVVTLTKATASAKRINEVFEIKPSISYGAQSLDNNKNDNIVKFDNVIFKYNGSKKPALSNISFTANKGEKIGIIGGTGSGKTTLVNLIARFYDANSGSILINGVDIKQLKKETLTDIIGVVPQRASLFSGSIRDNMLVGNSNASDDDIFEALRIAQAEEFVNTKKEKLDYIISQGGKNLSGGQKQRLTIARALVKKPQILILDDSASALDYATDAKLRKAIKEKIPEMTVFIVSQRVSSVIDANRIIVLSDGEIAGIGTHSELAEKCKVYREICQSQLSEDEM